MTLFEIGFIAFCRIHSRCPGSIFSFAAIGSALGKDAGGAIVALFCGTLYPSVIGEVEEVEARGAVVVYVHDVDAAIVLSQSEEARQP